HRPAGSGPAGAVRPALRRRDLAAQRGLVRSDARPAQGLRGAPGDRALDRRVVAAAVLRRIATRADGPCAGLRLIAGLAVLLLAGVACREEEPPPATVVPPASTTPTATSVVGTPSPTASDTPA